MTAQWLHDVITILDAVILHYLHHNTFTMLRNTNVCNNNNIIIIIIIINILNIGSGGGPVVKHWSIVQEGIHRVRIPTIEEIIFCHALPLQIYFSNSLK